MRRRLSRWPLGVELTICDTVTLRASMLGPSRWPPFIYPEVGVSIRWGRSHGRWAWRHYGVNACDLGTLALSVHQRRLHVSVLLVHLGVDLPWSACDRGILRLSLSSAVGRWTRGRRALGVGRT